MRDARVEVKTRKVSSFEGLLHESMLARTRKQRVIYAANNARNKRYITVEHLAGARLLILENIHLDDRDDRGWP